MAGTFISCSRTAGAIPILVALGALGAAVVERIKAPTPVV